jgi:hypothetical protein
MRGVLAGVQLNADNGRLTIASPAGQGTRLTADLPLR